jgi:AcrR family transcriptional regulator
MTVEAQDADRTPSPNAHPAPSGRSAQKRRTRRAIIEAAVELVREGVVPTVAQAAERAEVSRATAYRYFPTQGSLIVHTSTPLEDLRRVLEQADDEDVAHRVELLVRAIAQWCYDNRTVLTELTHSIAEIPDSEMDSESMHHRQYWIDEALAPVRYRLDDAAYARLFGALTLYVGPEPIAVMQTVSRLPRDEAIDTLAWSASTLVRAQLAECGLR